MRSRSVIFVMACILAVFAPLWSEPVAQSVALKNSMKTVDSATVAKSLSPLAGAYREHAPLAFFSLGSLAVGGVFYGISHGMDKANVGYTAGDRTQISTAVGVAGVTALLAAGSYFYYVHRSVAQSQAEGSDWDAQVIGGPDGDGGVTVGARLTVPLP